jgi:2-keto-4-pentenoate hydratase/2-oxohepta-3-ene-1,7-dioic acid hydratase in catechol pathway
MRIANADGRLALVTAGHVVVDVADASDGRFGPDVQDVYDHWTEFRRWAWDGTPADGTPLDEVRLGPVAPRPHQIFAIGLNYRGHAVETGLDIPDAPMVFTKFASSITGPYDAVALPTDSTDFEAELVVVIGATARRVARADAWRHVAGLTVGQDISERELLVRPPTPQQFSLAKSFPNFAPIGPVLVTPDEFDDPDDLEIGCAVGGEQLQKARTSDLIFSVSWLVEYLSAVLTLLPGDLIFTGTPAGVGFARKPQRYLRAGEELVTTIEGIGELRNPLVHA